MAVVKLPVPGLVSAALTTRAMLDHLDVEVVVLLGIAGAIRGRDVALGDVVIPHTVFDYEAVKVTDEGDEPNGLIEATSSRLHGQIAAARFDDWAEKHLRAKPRQKRWVGSVRASPSVVYTDCSMASGHKVIASNDRAQLLRDRHRKPWLSRWNRLVSSLRVAISG